MPKLAANLTMMFTEVPFLERFKASRACGFKGVEYLFPYDWPAAELKSQLHRHDLIQVLFNLPPGDWEKGERGLAALPGREDEFRAGLDQAIDYATVLGCKQLHTMAGIIGTDDDLQQMQGVYIKNLQFAAAQCARANIRLLIEPINNTDMPGYYLNTSAHAADIISKVRADNLFLQYDIYHMQIMEGHLSKSLETLLPLIGHMQLASVPLRHEPNLGEINYSWLLNHIDELGYDEWIGCEYRPRRSTEQGLGWAAEWGIQQPDV